MQSRLDRIRHAGPGPQHFLRTLQTLSGAIAEAPATTIDALSYRDESLDMKVTAPSLAALSQLSQSVGKQGLTAEIQSSTPMGSGCRSAYASAGTRLEGAPMNKLKAWYAGLQTREQRVVGIGAAVLGALILFAGIVWPLESAVSSAVKTRETRTDDLAWMRINAPEIQAGSATVSANTARRRWCSWTCRARSWPGQRPARHAAQRRRRTGSARGGPLRHLGDWLASLDERYGLAIESISVDRAAKPGVVNANITFAPSKH